MPSIGVSGEQTELSSCSIAGWGRTEFGRQSPVLKDANVGVMSQSYCEATAKRTPPKEKFQFCAGKRPNGRFYQEDSCKGDSGGPLVCKTVNGYLQVGTVSKGGRCGDARDPGVYGKVAAAYRWIRDTTRNTTVGNNGE